MGNENSSDKDQITVNRAKYDSITLYEISEEELDIVERGSPSSNYLNFALVLLTIFVSFLISLLLNNIQGKKFTFFLIVTVITAVVGVILLILWLLSYKSSKRVFSKIRSRKNVEKVREIIAEEQVIDAATSEKEDIQQNS